MNAKSPTSRRTNLSRDFFASVVVFLVALPLCMGIAIASGAPVSAGLVTGIVGGIVAGSLAGCQLQVSGPAAGLTVIVYGAIQEHGLEMLGLIVLLTGLMQLALGFLRMGRWFRAVSPAVIKGMLAGIGVLIMASQIHVMMDDRPRSSGVENIVSIPEAFGEAMRQPTLPEVSIRQGRQKLLVQFGELHREQSALEEHLAEVIPHHRMQPGPLEEKLDLTEYIGEQERINQQVAALTDELKSVPHPTEKKHQRSETAAAEVHAQGLLALEALQAHELLRVLSTQKQAVSAYDNLWGGLKNHEMAAMLGIATILILAFWKVLAIGPLKLVPAPLVAVVAVTAVAAIIKLPVLYVEVPDNIWNDLHFPTPTLLMDAQWIALIQAAVLMAVVASAETLLSANAVDQLHSGPRTKYDRELIAQGAGNTVVGFLGGLPMTGVIVRSSANVQAGATSRASAVMHGFWLLLFVVFLSFVLRMIPTSALAAILVYTGFKLVDIKSIKKLWEFGWMEVAIYAVTVLVIVTQDLLSGILAGIALAAARLLYTFSRLEVEVQQQSEGRATLKLEGAATFVRLPRLAEALESVPPGTKLNVEFQHLDYLDHACLELLMNWAKQHESTGGGLSIDWDSLHAIVQAEKGGNGGASGRLARRKSAEEKTPALAEATSDAGDSGKS